MFMFRYLNISKENLDVYMVVLFGLLTFAIECVGEKIFPGDWMCPVNKGDEKKKKDANKDEEECNEPKGDPEMAPIYLKRLLPVFAQTFQQTMLPSIR